MTTDLDRAIRSSLSDIIDAAPQPDDQPIRLVTVNNETSTRRPYLAVAAALVALAGVGALVAISNNDRTPISPAAAPVTTDDTSAAGTPSVPAVEPTLFPVLDDVPQGLSPAARVDRTDDEALWVESLIGRYVDNVLTDAVTITVQSQPFSISPMADHPPTEANVLGEPATVYDYGANTGVSEVHVTWGSGPYFLASGAAPLAFLGAATSDTFNVAAQSDADQPPTLSFGQLPDGFEVIAPARVVGTATVTATLSIGADNYDISVSTRNPVVYMSLAGPLRRIEVAGRPGWTFLSSFNTQDIAWQVDESTFAYLKVNDGTDAAGALALANSITFVGWDSWVARYAPEPA